MEKLEKIKNTYTKTDIEDSYMNIEKYIFKRKYERNNGSSRKEVINIVKELNQKEGMTIILITHHTDEVVDADRIILMKDGKIIGDDIPKKIFADRSLLKRAKMDIPPVVELGMRLKKQKIGLDEPVLHEQEMIRKITELYRSKCGGWKDAAR